MGVTREFHFSIDRGGTFTDVFAQVGGVSMVGLPVVPDTRLTRQCVDTTHTGPRWKGRQHIRVGLPSSHHMQGIKAMKY